jgi:hypothetical protein
VKDEAEVMGSQSPFMDFLDLGLCNGYGDVGVDIMVTVRSIYLHV